VKASKYRGVEIKGSNLDKETAFCALRACVTLID